MRRAVIPSIGHYFWDRHCITSAKSLAQTSKAALTRVKNVMAECMVRALRGVAKH
jgi:hypothetical protein